MTGNNQGTDISEANQVQPSIRSFILKKFPAARKRLLDDDVQLLASGIVDSLGVLDVVTFLEQTFKLKIEDDELTPDNFGSIRQLTSFVAHKQIECQGYDLSV